MYIDGSTRLSERRDRSIDNVHPRYCALCELDEDSVDWSGFQEQRLNHASEAASLAKEERGREGNEGRAVEADM